MQSFFVKNSFCCLVGQIDLLLGMLFSFALLTGCCRSQDEVLKRVAALERENLHTEAVKELEYGVNKKYPLAMERLAFILWSGEPSNTNRERAFRLWHTAAQMGVVNSMYRTAECYRWGIGTKVDKSCAYHWLKTAAHAGFVRAIYDYLDFAAGNIANCVLFRVDFEESKILLEMAASQDSSGEAEYRIAELLLKRNRNAYRSALKQLKIASTKGYWKSHERLAHLFFEGTHGFPKDWDAAMDYCLSSREEDDDKILGMKSLICLKRGSRWFDTKLGIDFLERAKPSKVLSERRKWEIIGFAHLRGSSFLPNLNRDAGRAIPALIHAEECGSKDASMALGFIYATGLNQTNVDLSKAKFYFHSAMYCDEYAADAKYWSDVIDKMDKGMKSCIATDFKPSPYQSVATDNQFPSLHKCINDMIEEYCEAEKQKENARQEQERIKHEEMHRIAEQKAVARRLEKVKKNHSNRNRMIFETNQNLFQIQKIILKYQKMLGDDSLPESLETLGGMRAWVNTRDAWGRYLRYKVDGKHYSITSAGPDGIFDTEDDLSVNSH